MHPLPDPFAMDWDNLSETELKRLVIQVRFFYRTTSLAKKIVFLRIVGEDEVWFEVGPEAGRVQAGQGREGVSSFRQVERNEIIYPKHFFFGELESTYCQNAFFPRFTGSFACTRLRSRTLTASWRPWRGRGRCRRGCSSPARYERRNGNSCVCMWDRKWRL